MLFVKFVFKFVIIRDLQFSLTLNLIFMISSLAFTLKYNEKFNWKLRILNDNKCQDRRGRLAQLFLLRKVFEGHNGGFFR